MTTVSVSAAQQALLSKLTGVREIILHHVVRETEFPMGADAADTLATEAAKKTLAAAREYLRSLNPAIRVTISSAVAADITDGILAAAEENGADLIVVGAHPKGVRRGVLLGSVPSTLLCRVSNTSVLFMRHKIVATAESARLDEFLSAIEASPNVTP